MRIYKSDGTYTENSFDTEFGWNFQDIAIDEADSSYEQKNQEVRAMAALRKAFRIPNASLQESIDTTNLEIETKKRLPIKIKRIESDIKIQEAESTIEPIAVNACLSTINEDEETFKFENIDSKIPPKQQVANLINPCSVESKMLLSVIYFAKYKNLVKDIINLGDIRGSSKIKVLVGQKSEDIEDNLRREIRHYHQNKEDNMLSIMMELILKDTNSEMNDITDCDNDCQNQDSSDLGISIEEDSDNEDFSSLNRFESLNRSEFLSSIGLSDVIDRSIERICEETYDMHVNIAKIKKSLLEEEARVNALIEEAQALGKNLRETKYLDDLIQLLDGKLEKISLKKSPFRIFISPSNTDEQNFII